MTDLSDPNSPEAAIVQAAGRILRDYARHAEAWQDHAGAGELVASEARHAAANLDDVLAHAARWPLRQPSAA